MENSFDKFSEYELTKLFVLAGLPYSAILQRVQLAVIAHFLKNEEISSREMGLLQKAFKKQTAIIGDLANYFKKTHGKPAEEKIDLTLTP